MRKIIFLLVCIIYGGIISNAASPIYIGSVPADKSTISSFENITINFDLSEVIAEYGEGEWGICCNATYNAKKPDQAKAATLYKGTSDDGEVIGRIYETIKPQKEAFEVGSDFHLSYADVEVETGQEYTLVLTYDLYAGKEGESTWEVGTKVALLDDPIIITFYGASEVAKVLSMESNSIESGVQYETIPAVKVSFNHDVAVNDNATATLYEESTTIATSTGIAVDADDSKTIVISFPEETIYYGHTYTVVLPEGAVYVAGESDVVNSEISVSLEGASYRSFGTGRVRPSNGSVTVLGEITIPFNFPTAEDKNYGFVALDDDDTTQFTAYLYAGSDDSTDPVETMIGTVTSDMKGLVFNPSIVPNPETEYTVVIPEGNVKAYEIGAMRTTYLKDYISERVELHYTTPAVSDLPLWQPNAVNVSDGDELDHIDYYIVDCPDYEYDGTIYETVAAQITDLGGVLYEVTADGEKEISTFRITRQALTSESEVGNGQYIGRYFVGEVNQDLYAGKEYRVVMTANKFIVKNNFIGNYIGNSEVSVTLKGAASTELNSELTSNIAEGHSVSHLGVVSFYTADPVAAVEGAALELRNGEDVKTAHVRVASEDGYSHIYADFSDADHKALALDRGVEYTVVLPQGSVAHTENENLVNTEYSVAINGLAEEVETTYHNVTLSVNDCTVSKYVVESGKTVEIEVSPLDSDWELSTLTLDGTDVTADVADGKYVTPAVESDIELAAEFAYTGNIQFVDATSDIANIAIEGSNYTVGNEGEKIVISNVEPGDHISVYTVNGMLVASHEANNNVVKISLPSGIYIVRVNNVTFKIQH